MFGAPSSTRFRTCFVYFPVSAVLLLLAPIRGDSLAVPDPDQIGIFFFGGGFTGKLAFNSVSLPTQ